MVSKRAFLGVALLLTIAAPAYADPTAAEKETARTLMAEGRARREKNDAPGALESFRAADAIMHVPTTGLEVAKSQLALGQLVEARDTLHAVLRLPKKPREPQPFQEARTQAQALDDDLAARIPSLRVVLEGPHEGASVQIDDVPLPAEAIGVAFKVNPGHHVIRATAANANGSAEADVQEKEEKVVTIALQEAPVAEAPPPPPPLEESHTGPRALLIYGGAGLAAGGIVVGTISGIVSLSHAGSVKDTCVNNMCPRSSADDLDTAKTTATISTIGFIAAGAGATLLVVGLLMHDSPEKADEKAARAHVVPWIGPGSAGVRGTF